MIATTGRVLLVLSVCVVGKARGGQAQDGHPQRRTTWPQTSAVLRLRNCLGKKALPYTIWPCSLFASDVLVPSPNDYNLQKHTADGVFFSFTLTGRALRATHSPNAWVKDSRVGITLFPSLHFYCPLPAPTPQLQGQGHQASYRAPVSPKAGPLLTITDPEVG